MTRLISLSVWLLTLALVFGHEMWLEPESFFVDHAGERLIVRNGNGTIYETSENAVTPERIAKLIVSDPSGSAIESDPLSIRGNWLEIPFTPKVQGNYWVGLATKPNRLAMSGEEFMEYLEHDGIPNILREREEKGIRDRDEVEQYSKYVKAYLQVGQAISENFDRPQGLEIEIVPLVNPYSVQVGSVLPVQVLYKGKPLSGLTLHAGTAGRSESSAAVETDGEGKARILISGSGRWYVRGIHLSQVDQDDYSYESFWVTLTFEVRS